MVAGAFRGVSGEDINCINRADGGARVLRRVIIRGMRVSGFYGAPRGIWGKSLRLPVALLLAAFLA